MKADHYFTHKMIVFIASIVFVLILFCTGVSADATPVETDARIETQDINSVTKKLVSTGTNSFGSDLMGSFISMAPIFVKLMTIIIASFKLIEVLLEFKQNNIFER